MFAPLFDPEYTINIYSRRSRDKGLKDVFDTLLQPEIWPVKLEDLPANISFVDLDEKDIIINDDIQISNSLHAHPNGAYSIKLKILNKTIPEPSNINEGIRRIIFAIILSPIKF